MLEAHSILIVEDDEEIANLLALHLEELGADVTLAVDGDQGLRLIESQNWDVAILDIQLPGVGGLSLCRRLRSLKTSTAIIMLTARSSEADRVLGLEQGADDYVTKPFSVLELIARLKAQCRRVNNLKQHFEQKPATGITEAGNDQCLQFGPIRIDPLSRMTLMDEQPVDLTMREFDLLSHFCRHPNQVFSRAELLDRVWGYNHDGYEHTVNSHINRLRTKIEPDPANPALIVTVWGVGYKLQPQTAFI